MKLDDNIKILNEKIYGNLATVYHGSESKPELFFEERFKPGHGAGSMYGKGIYTIYELQDSSNTVNGSYGSTIVKIVTSTYKMVNFDELAYLFNKHIIRLTKNEKEPIISIEQKLKPLFERNLEKEQVQEFLNEPENKNLFSIFSGLESLFVDQLKKMGFNNQFIKLFSEWIKSGNGYGWYYFLKAYSTLYSSAIAYPFSQDFSKYFTGNSDIEYINGIIFTGARDGNVCVIYNLNNYLPISYVNLFKINFDKKSIFDPSNWTKISKEDQTDFYKSQKEYFSKHRFIGKEKKKIIGLTSRDKLLSRICDEILSIKSNPSHVVDFSSVLNRMKNLKVSFNDLAEFHNRIYTHEYDSIDENMYDYMYIWQHLFEKADIKSAELMYSMPDFIVFLDSQFYSYTQSVPLLWVGITKNNILEIGLEKSSSPVNHIEYIVRQFIMNYQSESIKGFKKEVKETYHYIILNILSAVDLTSSKFITKLNTSILNNNENISVQLYMEVISEENIPFPIDLDSISTISFIDAIMSGSLKLEKVLKDLPKTKEISLSLVLILRSMYSYTRHNGERGIKVLEYAEILINYIYFHYKNLLEEFDAITSESNSHSKLNVLDYFVYNLMSFGNYDYNLGVYSSVELGATHRHILFLDSKGFKITDVIIAYMLDKILLMSAKKEAELISIVSNAIARDPYHYLNLIDIVAEVRSMKTIIGILTDKRLDTRLETLVSKSHYARQLNLIRQFLMDVLQSDVLKYEDVLNDVKELQSMSDEENKEIEQIQNPYGVQY